MALALVAPVITLLAAPASATLLAAPAAAETAAAPAFKVLVFSKTTGFRHDAIPEGIAAVGKLGQDNNFAVDTTEDSALFTDDNLAQYQAVIFISTTGDPAPAEQAGSGRPRPPTTLASVLKEPADEPHQHSIVFATGRNPSRIFSKAELNELLMANGPSQGPGR
ncbi:ThuA domain-containing protein [Nonomuraea sp. GTA35]|uniref:ThuA domain-containing protein n=1 Tax=Nonomuraea sp. GTA35 TaxID=1676746 RepID=UPI0035C09512